jgi:LPXTG-motif cell wall-anchored protein
VLTWRRILASIAVLGVLLLVTCSAALADSSAGNSQYSDPLGPSNATPPAPQTHTSATPLTPAAPPSVSSSPGSATPPSTGSQQSTSAPAGPTLPNTGIDAWLAGALGVGLAGLGVAVRRTLSAAV